MVVEPTKVSMIYSVFDHDIGKFRYYTGEEMAPGAVPKTHHLLGTAADDATPGLPLFAKEVGTGEEAIGRIAKPGVNFKSLVKLIMIGLAIYGAWTLIEGR